MLDVWLLLFILRKHYTVIKSYFIKNSNGIPSSSSYSFSVLSFLLVLKQNMKISEIPLISSNIQKESVVLNFDIMDIWLRIKYSKIQLAYTRFIRQISATVDLPESDLLYALYALSVIFLDDHCFLSWNMRCQVSPLGSSCGVLRYTL